MAADSGLDALARRFLAEDLQLAISAAQGLSSARRSTAEMLGPLLAPFWARIVYEGSISLLRKSELQKNEQLRPAFDRLKYTKVIADSRHSQKILSARGGFNTVQRRIVDLEIAHRSRFLGKVWRPLRFLESDLGIFESSGWTVGTTWSVHLQMGLDAKLINQPDSMNNSAMDFAREMGETLVYLHRVLGLQTVTEPVDWSGVTITSHDVKSDNYYRRRFGTVMSSEDRITLSLIECQVNFLIAILESCAPSHTNSVHRAFILGAFHALDSLKRLARKYRSVSRETSERLASHAEGATSRSILQARELRDRCMHYRTIRKPGATAADLADLIQATTQVDPTTFLRSVREVLAVISTALKAWQ